jgi:acyl-CoA thioester hydrolase
MGVVYYAHYLVYFERGRTELLRELGVPYKNLEEDGTLLPVIEVCCTYCKPAYYDDIIDISSRILDIQGIRIQIECEIYRDGILLARGHTWHVITDTNGKPKRIPDVIQKLFTTREN